MVRDKMFMQQLTKSIENISYKANEVKKVITLINSNTAIPKGILSDYLTLRVPVDDASDFIIYSLASYFLTKKQITSVFSEQEIKYYETAQYEMSKISFPLKFNMVQITPNQWIGRVTVKELMQLRDAQMINYNEKTQRTLERRINRGGFEYYKISINESAVREIEESYESGAYISNTITLNLSDESEVDYVYDPKSCILTIKAIKYFDILDGYHRYRAMSKAYLKDENFDYDMELRIVHFDEREAKQFIWQEDQKTKMTKVESEGYNQNDMAVMITERISKGLPAGIISRNQGKINQSQLIVAVKFCYDTNKIKSVGEAGVVAKELKTKFEELMMDDPDLFEVRWSTDQIYNTIVTFKNTEQVKADFIKRITAYTEGMGYWKTNPTKKKFNSLYNEYKGGEKK